MSISQIQTFTGRFVDPLNADVNQIDIIDIAHALSNICRFTGHCKSFYSVAQHSVIVSYLCPPKFALHCLMHDATEAYLSDISRPIKYSEAMEGYRSAEERLSKIIYTRFNLPTKEPPEVKYADDLALVTEARDLMATPYPNWKIDLVPHPDRIVPWQPEIAKSIFLARFCEVGEPMDDEIKEIAKIIRLDYSNKALKNIFSVKTMISVANSR